MELDIQAHLEKVSRSFAFCIARLDQPLREQVGLSYLLCRILDTVEDAHWTCSSVQKGCFNDFIEVLSDQRKANLWSVALLQNASKISESEAALVRETELVVQALQKLSIEARKVVIPPVISMAQGMREFAQTRNTNHGRLHLKTLQDVNHYCFFVAGVVGEILDGLLRIEASKRGITVQTKLSDGFRFGLFLQKVNVLKDRDSDLNEGRDLVPVVADVFHSSLVDAERAFAYIQAIPHTFKSYRLFCAWSMFLGLASLPHIAQGRKIGRLETVSLLAKVEIKIDSPRSLEAFFAAMLGTAKTAALVVKTTSLSERENASAGASTSELGSSRKEFYENRIAFYRSWYVGAARDEDLNELIGSV